MKQTQLRNQALMWLVCLLLSFSSMNGILKAQTTIINPAGDGGFETGSTFIANGWTSVGYAGELHTNWYLGSGMINGSWVLPSVSRCAYISDNSGLNWSYNAKAFTKPSTVHFYRSVTFPAAQTNIKLSFDVVTNGETANYDVLYVWLCPTSLTPSVGTPLSASDIAVWTGTGTPTLLYKLQGTSKLNTQGTTNVRIAIPAAVVGNCSSSKTYRLVFSWKNDESMHYDVPAAIDNISLTSSAVTPAINLGAYTINNTLPTSGLNFNNFTDAISWINAAANCNTINAPITFNVSAGQVFYENTPVITATGSVTANITFQKSGTGANPLIKATGSGSNYDAGITISGGDYFTFDGIDIGINSGRTLEYGYLIKNASASNGAKNNTIKNCNITLDREIIKSIGILQSSNINGGGFTPTGTNGMNSNNSYQYITISNCYNGILLTCNSEAFIDETNQVNNCTIGADYTGIPFGDMGGDMISVYGIQAYNQKTLKVYNNVIRNMAGDGTNVKGIVVFNAKGSCQINNNLIRGLRNTDNTSIASVIGIDVGLYPVSGAHTIKVYNNAISDITSAYTGSNQPDKVLIGIETESGTSSSTYYIDFNNVSIDGSASPRISSVAMKIGTTVTKNYIRNNIFANYTISQSGSATHYAIMTPSSNSMGASGSVCDNNDYYVPIITSNGYIGLGGNSKYQTLANWKSGMTANTGLDAASKTVDPAFTNTVSDLHTHANILNDAGNMTSITWVTTDMDNETRESVPDIGADEFYSSAVDYGVNNITAPVAVNCFGNTESVTVKIKNFGASTASLVLNPVKVKVTCGAPVVFADSVTINTGILTSGSTLNITMPTLIDMSASGTYSITAATSTTGDTNAGNNSLVAVRTNDAPAAIPYAEDFNATAAAPAGYGGVGFNYGTHTGAIESNQAYRHTNAANPTGNFIIKKVGPLAINSAISFNYRVLNFGDEGTAEEDTLWGNITVSISTDCGNTFAIVSTVTDAELNYSNYTVALGAFTGDNVFIKIQSNWGGGAEADYWVDIDNILISNLTCTGIPAPGIATAAVTAVCPGSSAMAQVVGADHGFGITYQWYSSNNGILFTPVPGATDTIVNSVITDTTWLFHSVICTSSGLSSNSDTLEIFPVLHLQGETMINAISLGDLSVPFDTIAENFSGNCWTSDYGNISPDIFYSFTPYCNGVITAGLCGSDFDTKLYLLDAYGNLITMNDDACGTASQIITNVNMGNNYFLIVEGSGAAEGNYNLSVVFAPTNIDWYADIDADSYGDISDHLALCNGVMPDGYLNDASDCDDNDPAVHPGVIEVCDGIDNDCNGIADEGIVNVAILPTGPLTTCKGAAVTLSANAETGSSYQWYKNNNPVSGGTSNSINTAKPGNYTVQVTTPAGCFGVSAPVSLTENPLPVNSITTPFGTSLCTIVSLRAFIGTGYLYQWYKEGVIIAGATTFKHNPTTPGNYYCVVTNAFGCAKTTATVTVTACKSDDNSNPELSVLNIYPNPANSDLMIDLEGFAIGPVTCSFYNAAGRMVIERSFQITGGSYVTTMDISTLPNGIYWLKTTIGDQVSNTELVVQH